MASSIVNCNHCLHYYITWDPAFPRGCKTLKFKTKNMPSQVVLQSTGKTCIFFAPKENQK